MSFEPSIFRAYDMRGTYPDQLNEEVAYATGQAFVKARKAKRVVVARDVRDSGVSLQQAMIKGIIDAGADAINIGVVATEVLYFATATLECDGGMSVTASHNPSQWNGIKFMGPQAHPISRGNGLEELYEAIKTNEKTVAEQLGTTTEQNLTDAYIEFMQQFIPADLPQLKIVGNVNFGANGQYVDKIVEGLPLEMIRLNWEQDGTFPKGTPDPSLGKNRNEISARIVSEDANFGVAWDADADRCFFFDEKGRWFIGYYITAMLIKHFLSKEPGATAVIERRLVWANLKAAADAGGSTVYSRTGHGFIKAAMREHQAIVGGEMSGHFYFRDYFYCDSGLVTFLVILGIFAEEIKQGRKVSHILDDFDAAYPNPGSEINYLAPDSKHIIEEATKKYADGTQDLSDGLTVEYPEWRMSLRRSDNEPVMRLNLEARNRETLSDKLKEVNTFIESFGATLRNDNA